MSVSLHVLECFSLRWSDLGLAMYVSRCPAMWYLRPWPLAGYVSRRRGGAVCVFPCFFRWTSFCA